MRSLVLVVPGRLDTRTGGYGYDRRLIAGLADLGWQASVRELDDSFPRPTARALDEAVRVLADIPAGTTVVVDGLALGGMPSEVEREGARLQVVALVHHPLAAETGIDSVTAAAMALAERRALAASRLVIVTSGTTARALAEYDVPVNRVVVVPPGTDRAPLARGSGGGQLHLLVVAALIPRKGFEVLWRALATLVELDWTLTVVGSLDRDAATVARARKCLRDDGLEGRVFLAGEASDSAVADHYDRADVFVLPTLYEGYGMAVAEALARGLPVVSTPTGGIGELLSDGAGLLVPAGDVEALTEALAQVIRDEGVRSSLAAGARRVRDRLPGWDHAAALAAEALEWV
jgi:glycosyltransferase involved in cell wall biosynthesis